MFRQSFPRNYETFLGDRQVVDGAEQRRQGEALLLLLIRHHSELHSSQDFAGGEQVLLPSSLTLCQDPERIYIFGFFSWSKCLASGRVTPPPGHFLPWRRYH